MAVSENSEVIEGSETKGRGSDEGVSDSELVNDLCHWMDCDEALLIANNYISKGVITDTGRELHKLATHERSKL